MWERIIRCIPPNPRRVGYIVPIHGPLYMGSHIHQYFPLTPLQQQPPATSQTTMFFSHTTPAVASSTSTANRGRQKKIAIGSGTLIQALVGSSLTDEYRNSDTIGRKNRHTMNARRVCNLHWRGQLIEESPGGDISRCVTGRCDGR